MSDSSSQHSEELSILVDSMPQLTWIADATGNRMRALRAGFLVDAAKPIDPSELVATVASLCGASYRPLITKSLGAVELAARDRVGSRKVSD